MTMQTRTELMNVAAMTAADVVGVVCTFELRDGEMAARPPKAYLYKCHKDLAKTLAPGDLVLAEYEGQQASQRDRPVTSCLVKEVMDFFDPEDLTIRHRWIFAKVDLPYLRSLQTWENETTDVLIRARRRRAREVVMMEITGSAGARPELPAPPKA